MFSLEEDDSTLQNPSLWIRVLFFPIITNKWKFLQVKIELNSQSVLLQRNQSNEGAHENNLSVCVCINSYSS